MRTLSLALCLVLAAAARAQEGFELGGAVGVGHYFGDLNTDFTFADPGPAAAVLARYNFSNRWSVRFGGAYTRVSGSDADSRNVFERARNLDFRSDVFDGALGLEFNFLQYDHGSRDRFYTPYIFGGLLVSNFRPQAELRGEFVNLRDFGTEGQLPGEEYYTTALGIDYGIGMKLDLSFEWSLNFELHARQLFTDYLDDVSGAYPDFEDLANDRGPDAVLLSDPSILLPGVNTERLGLTPGRQRGNPSDNDQYAVLQVGLFYYFGDLKCPEW